MVGVGESVGLATTMLGLVTAILDIAGRIVALAEAAQRNREKCNLLKEHVQMIILLLRELDRQWIPDPVTNGILENLKAALDEGMALVESCQQKRTWSRVFKTQKKAQKFDALGIRISRILELFHVVNMILIVSINKERFFMNVLEKLLQDGACRRLPQSVKEELKSSIKGLTNSDNMSSEAKRVLGRIIKELTHGDAETCSSSVRPRGLGGEEASRDDLLTVEVMRLTDFIVQEAKALRQNRDEIQLLAQFVQQIADLVMRLPQPSELSRDPKTRPTVNSLKHDLEEAYRIVLYNSKQHRNNRFMRAISCGVDNDMSGYLWQQPDHILRVAYKIEYYVHVLPVITIRQIYEQN